MNRSNTAQFVALALFGIACGPPKLTSVADAESSDETSSSSSSSSSETGPAETSTTETGTTETTGDWTFVPELDVWETIECDSFAQDCPDGQKCVPYGSTGGGWDAHKCVPVLGDQAPGEPCTYSGTEESIDDCDATSFCWDVNQEYVGTCTSICAGTNDDPECPPGTSVLYGNVLCLCIPTCDPILQDCNEGLACFWANNGFNCIFTTSDIPSGEPCGFINDCAQGNACITAEVLPNCAGAACCSPWCQLGDGDLPCEVLPGSTCVPFFEQDMAPPGYDHIGICLLPP
jgi:hypothetical protein